MAARGINRPDGIPRQHLRSLVKNDDIEWKLGRFKVRADRERTHHQTRFESDESIRHASEIRSPGATYCRTVAELRATDFDIREVSVDANATGFERGQTRFNVRATCLGGRAASFDGSETDFVTRATEFDGRVTHSRTAAMAVCRCAIAIDKRAISAATAQPQSTLPQ